MTADLLASHVIQPHEDDRIIVGEYETKELVPRLAISYESEGWVAKDDVQWVESHLVLEDGSVRVIVFVTNYSTHAVTLHVRQDDEER